MLINPAEKEKVSSRVYFWVLHMFWELPNVPQIECH